MKNNKYNSYIINTGIGLQDVDKLKNSQYFLNEANRYIKGEISLKELDETINSYYKIRSNRGDRTEEADKISIRIAKIISEDSFTFSVGQLLTIHQTLFEGILKKPGQFRTYNFKKKEWVLDGDSVTYGDYRDLERALQYDFEQEKKFKYQGLSKDEIVEHLAIFISNLWQNHVFTEGNTRTTATFFIKYLRSLGFDVTNDTFAKNAWYFRNALVRANYNKASKWIFEDRSYLIKFLRNLLLGEHNVLKNRELHISVAVSDPTNITREDKIIELIKTNPSIKTTQLAEALGVSLRTIKSLIKALEQNKRIERINGKRYGYWKIL
ncbi:MAG: Fic family protein [Bacilli bacterium]|nr:Fic family protein [Bacilli bacterium]